MDDMDVFIAKMIGATVIQLPPNLTEPQKFAYFIKLAKVTDPKKVAIFQSLSDLYKQHKDLPLTSLAEIVVNAEPLTLHVEMEFGEDKLIIIKGVKGKVGIVAKQGSNKIFEQVI